jgi:putative hydrolase of the HAD superfamily
MGVIFTEGDDVNNLLIPYLQRINPDFRPNKIRDIYVQASAGEITNEQFWRQMGFGAQYPAIEQNFLNHWFILDPEFKTIASRLKEKFRLGILSNDLGAWSSFLREKYALNSLFDAVVVSGDVGCRKPDRHIFEILLQKLGDSARNCAFIDDKRINLATASELGFTTIQFVRGAPRVNDEKLPLPLHEITSFTELPTLFDIIK